MKSPVCLPAFSLAPVVFGVSRGSSVLAPSRRSSLAFVEPPMIQSRSILKSDRDTGKHSSAASLWAQQGGGNGGNSGDAPEDFIQNFFQTMMQNAGGADSVFSFDIDEVGGGAGNIPTEDPKLAEHSLASLRSFDLKPREVVEYLDKYVIQQRDAKRVLATAICDHYNHCRRCLDGEEGQLAQESYAKPNILLAGPTGVGKTYLLKTIARLIGVPFVKGDATKFSETGIVGKDAEDLVRDLVSAAGGNTTLAQYGIIYIDEVDKIASGGGGDLNMGSFRGDLARGVQNNFLKLLEDTDVPLQGNSPFEMMSMGGGSRGTINTRNILFIFSGAFTGLDAAIRRKKETKPFGLDLDGLGDSLPASRDENYGKKTKKRSYLQYAETKDFVNAGLEPEFVGRVPVRVALNSLDAADLKQILVQAEGSVLKQFKRDFEGYGIEMTVTDDALTRVAEFAEEEATGARGLVTILERTLRGHKYELPSTSIRKFDLDARTVEEPGLALQALLSTQTEQDELFVRLDDLKRWERYANRLVEPFSIWLTDEAIDHMINLSISNGKNKSAYSLARDHFDALPAAVKKIGESTGQSQFPISLDMAKDPNAEIANWLSFIGPGEQANSASLDTDTSGDHSTTTDGASSPKSPSPQTPPPAAPKKSESSKVPGRDSDINNLIGDGGKAPGFCSAVAKSLTFGAPGRFPYLESLSATSSMTEFDLETARGLLREEANKAGLSVQDACEEFAKVVNCMIIDIIDHASSTLEKEATGAMTKDNPTVDAMNAAMDFMDHSAGLFEPFLLEGVSIKPVTYCGTLAKDKLEQLYAIYSTALYVSAEVTEDRIDMFRELCEITEERARSLHQAKFMDILGEEVDTKGGEGISMEEIMKAMGGMEGVEGLSGMGDEELTPEQLKEGVNMMKNLVESGQVSKEDMKLVKEMFKSSHGVNIEDLIYTAESAEVKEELGDASKDIIEMFKIILDATEDTSGDESAKKKKKREES